MTLSRRAFLWSSGSATLGFVGLRSYLEDPHAPLRARGYGPPASDPNGILDLPAGFTSTVISRTGETMDDGLLVPGGHDGMAAFAGADGRTILVRNHELLPLHVPIGPFGPANALLSKIDPALLYDRGRGTAPGLGGTTTIVYNSRERRRERHFLSLAGTWRNCAGGSTPWDSWLSCEEAVHPAGGSAEQDHGFVFEVPASAEMRLAPPVPLKAMGRFNHEAAAVHPRSGCVYLTEDRGGKRVRRPEDRGMGLLYRFTPAKPGELARGGRLQALRIRDTSGADTSNWRETLVAVGQSVDVDWIDLDAVESPCDDLRHQGHARGAARFTRGEGIWAADDAIWFCCTDGGPQEKGQVWRYRPGPEEGRPGEKKTPGRLELFAEPNARSVVDNCDNLTIAPWGDVILCEDGRWGNRMVGVTPAGKAYRLAENVLNSSELCGATFAPDASALFVNIQTPGLTLAIHPPGGTWTPPPAV